MLHQIYLISIYFKRYRTRHSDKNRILLASFEIDKKQESFDNALLRLFTTR